MDGLTFSGLTSASLRVFTADRGGETSPAVAFVPSREGPVDFVDIANAVRQPEEYDAVRTALERELSPERIPGSLWGLMEAIKSFYEEALQKAREERPDFFEKLKDVTDKFLGAENAQEMETVGQLVAASSPEDMDKFLAAADEMARKLLGPDSQVQEPGKGPQGLKFTASDVTISIQPQSEKSVTVQFQSAKLTAQKNASGGSTDRPVVELNAKNGDFTVGTKKATA